MDQHLGITFHTFVELLVSARYIIYIDLVRDNERWLSPAGYNKVPQIAIIRFDVALASPK